MFQPKPMRNVKNDISLDKQFENSKTMKGSYFVQELLIFVQKYELYHVNQSL
jgi:hypothetical protein